jgi:ElaB/YqjD/DUF883 family membrane-anchored ribosome-binding protein
MSCTGSGAEPCGPQGVVRAFATDGYVIMRLNGQRARKSAEAELQNLMSSSEELLQSLGEQSGDAVAALKLKLSRNISQAKNQLNELAQALEQVSAQAEEESRSFIARRPWVSVGIGIGVVLGLAVATVAAVGVVRSSGR